MLLSGYRGEVPKKKGKGKMQTKDTESNESNTKQGEAGEKKQGSSQGQSKPKKAKKAAEKKQGQAQGKKQGQGQKAKKEPKPKKEKPVRETPAHMSKVDKVAAQLPPLSENANACFVAANNMSTPDIVNLIQHLNIAVRKRGVAAADQLARQGKDNSDKQLKVGQRVQINTSQNPRFIGLQGTVSKVQRIRCYVEIDGKNYNVKKDGKGNTWKGDYFFTSDVSPVGGTMSSVQKTLEKLTQPAPGTDILSMAEDESGEDQAATGS